MAFNLLSTIGKGIAGISKFVPIPGASVIGSAIGKGTELLSKVKGVVKGKAKAIPTLTPKGSPASTVVMDTPSAIQREAIIDAKLKAIEDAEKVKMSLFGPVVKKPKINVKKALTRAFTISKKAPAPKAPAKPIDVKKAVTRAFTAPASVRKKQAEAKAKKAEEKMKMKKTDLSKVFDFEKERSLVKSNVSKTRANIRTLKKRNAKVPYAEARLIIKSKIQDAELALNALEKKMKSLSASSLSAEAVIALDPGQGMTLLKDYNADVLKINAELVKVANTIDGVPPATVTATGDVVPVTSKTAKVEAVAKKVATFAVPLAIGGVVLLLLTKKRR
jgi:hypothetical protein